MATSAVSLQQQQLDIIQQVANLQDLELVKKVKRYIDKLTAPKVDPLYTPENLAILDQSLKEYEEGRFVEMDMNQLRQHYSDK